MKTDCENWPAAFETMALVGVLTPASRSDLIGLAAIEKLKRRLRSPAFKETLLRRKKILRLPKTL